MKKEYSILIGISALFASTLVGYAFTRPSGDTNIPDGQQAMLGRFTGDLSQGQETSLPLPDGLFQATPDATLAATTDAAGNILYYHASNGFVSHLEIGSRKDTLVSQVPLPGLHDVVWSPDRQRVVTSYFVQQGMQYQYFDYSTHTHGQLPDGVTDAVFSPDSNLLAEVRQIGDESDVAISALDGTPGRVILKTHLPRIHIAWPQAHLLTVTTTDDAGAGTLYLLTDTGELTKIVSGESNLSTTWSPDGTRVLYSTTESGLMLYDVSTSTYQPQQVTTDASVCAWMPAQPDYLCSVADAGTTMIKRVAPGNAPQTILAGVIISPERVMVTSDSAFVVLVSKSDRSLYALKIAGL